MRPEWMVGAAGVLVVLVAIVWRQVYRNRVRSQVDRALRDADPARRRAAVGVATEQGLRTYARVLAARIEAETDPRVRAALVDGVLRNAWEPADRPSILRLRLWAHEERQREETSAALPYRRPTPPLGLPRHRAPAAARFPAVAGGHA